MNRLIIASLLLLISSWGHAAASVGKVILSFGQNVAVTSEGNERLLKRQSDIYADDLLKTGGKGRLQVRFTDGSRLSLKPNTEFKIEQYQFDDATPEDGKAIYKLLKGGMRTISGQIGKVDREDYKLDAVVATIGIRGTDFSVDKAGDKISGSVNNGRINVSAKQGSDRDIAAGRSFALTGAAGTINEFKTPAQSGSSEEESQSGDEESEESSEDSGTEEESDTSSSEGSSDSDDSATQQTGSDDQASTTQSEQQASSESTTESNLSLNTTTTTSSDSSGTTGSIPASNPSSDGASVVIASPNPTGNGSAAPEGAVVAIAFSENDPTKGNRGGSGVVIANNVSAITVDNSAGNGDLLTGILYVDTNTNTSSDNPCAPCSFTGADTTAQIVDSSNTGSISGASITWGRWNAGSYSVVENGTEQQSVGSFHFMYSDSQTSSSQLAAVAAAKSGQYLYTFSGGSQKYTKPESENGATGSLTGFTGSSSSTYQGTYLIVNWDSQTVDKVSIKGLTGTGGEQRNFTLTEETNASTGTSVQTSLDSLLKGGDLKLTGTCSGGTCATSTDLSGRMTMNLVGDSAGAALTSYGAHGTTSSSDQVTFTGTALLEDGGAVVP
ncbi:FecR family protein [Neptuniibacter caesariensis]|uniref:FecR protein domain-containing protein n=1 Tax=Neptuniibacter caesariensis TaxID=207954 RepID=A0A7U8C945_NEPCE|nr:FecR family protein [Neptuniibacter caesariensis]EAR62375.1 hypothetical protein MED92_15098 [Oceanospirillum sp. MED92] [Neptuniibacter caesariensis]